MDTKLTKVTTDSPERLAASIARIPQRRLGTPQDMAGVALFLASPLAVLCLRADDPGGRGADPLGGIAFQSRRCALRQAVGP